MDMKQCSAGHFYDAERYSSCPYCNKDYSSMNSEPHIVDRMADEDGNIGVTRPLGDFTFLPEADGVTLPLTEPEPPPAPGWLVCVDGPDKGCSFEIHNENNYLGRSPSMDINIPNDKSISRDKPLVITYDNRLCKFFCGFLNGKSLIRLNDMPLLNTVELNKGDILEIGQTKLMFVPFCGDGFAWEDNK